MEDSKQCVYIYIGEEEKGNTQTLSPCEIDLGTKQTKVGSY